MKQIKLQILNLLFCLGTALSAQAAVNESDTTNLVEQRLGYMKAVAAFKWHKSLPIEDLAREQTVLKLAVLDGLRFGLTRSSSERFFALQIEAAKEVQAYWFQQWQEHPDTVPETYPNLVTEVRPALLDLGTAIAASLSKASAGRPPAVPGLSLATAQALQLAINSVAVYPDRLTQVLDSKILRVGTTGDYAPFSTDLGDAEFTGSDIQLAKDLAAVLGAEIHWFKTSWPTLMADHQLNRFDIGMSGISINLERQKSAYFSIPYHEGGKTPIIRCNDKSRYTSLAQIDKPGVRLVVNPGGTNERYVLSNIKQATIKHWPDNRTIFQEIREGRADVMITDDIEVALQTRKLPGLCAAMPNSNLTYLQKGYLLPQDIRFKSYVDTWLSLRIGAGAVAQALEAELSEP